MHCLKYGLTVHNVMRVRGYTIDGELLELGSGALDGPGLDLLAVAIGSEGLLLIVTEVTVKLVPRPQLAQLVMASFDDVVKAGDAVAAIIAAGIIPAGLEMMDRKATAAVEPFVNAGLRPGCRGDSPGRSRWDTRGSSRPGWRDRACGARRRRHRVTVSSSEAERLRFWSGRKNAFPAAGRISADYYCMDGTIPRKNLGRMLKAIERMEQTHALRCMNVFHAGDGNLHPLIYSTPTSPVNGSAPTSSG